MDISRDDDMQVQAVTKAADVSSFKRETRETRLCASCAMNQFKLHAHQSHMSLAVHSCLRAMYMYKSGMASGDEMSRQKSPHQYIYSLLVAMSVTFRSCP